MPPQGGFLVVRTKRVRYNKTNVLQLVSARLGRLDYALPVAFGVLQHHRDEVEQPDCRSPFGFGECLGDIRRKVVGE